MGLLLVGCDPSWEVQPTGTPTNTSLPASPTIDPLLPTIFADDNGNASPLSFTPGAMPTAYGVAVTWTPTPLPTQTSLTMDFTMQDGLTVAATYYGAPQRPAKTILLLPMLNTPRSVWTDVAQALQISNFNVVAVDLRGQGDTGGATNWTSAIQDVNTLITRVSELPGSNGQVLVVGASIGANLALNGCTENTLCQRAVLISPALDYQGLLTQAAIQRYGTRPLLIIASRADAPSGTDSATLDSLALGPHRLILHEGDLHGIAILTSQPALQGEMIRWLQD